MPATIDTFTEGKNPPATEDVIGYANNSFVVADGSTTKSKELAEKLLRLYGKSGGTITAEIITQGILATNLNGRALVDYLTELIQAEYHRSLPEALTDPFSRFATTFVVARIVGTLLIVTQVGDTGFRINGKERYLQEREQDQLDAKARAEAIKLALSAGVPYKDAVHKGRETILPSLEQQPLLWNNADHPQGFGYLNGSYVPNGFIQTYEFPMDEVHLLEIFSDGYFAIPDNTTIADWEAAYHAAMREDPDRYLKYPSTKSNDDRAILRVNFEKP